MKDIWPFLAAAVAITAIWIATWIVERRIARKRRGRCWWCHATGGAHARNCPTEALGERRSERD